LWLPACARIGDPPGGPQDKRPPALVATYPESTAVLPGFKDNVEFQFDETVSEGNSPNFGLGTGELEKLVLLSPTKRVPVVRWHRSRITVRPREGWLPNRVYRVELLPGVVDLRQNRTKTGTTLTFSTGAPLPTRTIKGRVVDWSTNRGAPQALVEAVIEADSLVYRTRADSAGFFSFGPLPLGPLLVYGVLDANHNNRRDNREPFDTLRLVSGQDSVGEVWAFRHDSTGPRIQTIAMNDSVSISLTFTMSLNPYQRLPKDSVRVRVLPDSTDQPVVAILPKEAYDSVFAPPTAGRDSLRADSARGVRDTLRRPRPFVAPPGRRRGLPPVDTISMKPLTSRPQLYDRLLIRMGAALVLGRNYRVEVKGLQNANQVAGTAALGFKVPERKPPPDSTKAKADSGKGKGRARPDTTARRPPPPPPPPPGP